MATVFWLSLQVIMMDAMTLKLMVLSVLSLLNCHYFLITFLKTVEVNNIQLNNDI